jgi:hypothetical protein
MASPFQHSFPLILAGYSCPSRDASKFVARGK